MNVKQKIIHVVVISLNNVNLFYMNVNVSAYVAHINIVEVRFIIAFVTLVNIVKVKSISAQHIDLPTANGVSAKNI